MERSRFGRLWAGFALAWTHAKNPPWGSGGSSFVIQLGRLLPLLVRQ